MSKNFFRIMVYVPTLLAFVVAAKTASAKAYYCHGFDLQANQVYVNQILTGLSEDDLSGIISGYSLYLRTHYRATLPGGLALCKAFNSFDDARAEQKSDIQQFPYGVFTTWTYTTPKDPVGTSPGADSGLEPSFGRWHADDRANIEYRWKVIKTGSSSSCSVQFRNTGTDSGIRFLADIYFLNTASNNQVYSQFAHLKAEMSDSNYAEWFISDCSGIDHTHSVADR